MKTTKTKTAKASKSTKAKRSVRKGVIDATAKMSPLEKALSRCNMASAPKRQIGQLISKR